MKKLIIEFNEKNQRILITNTDGIVSLYDLDNKFWEDDLQDIINEVKDIIEKESGCWVNHLKYSKNKESEE